MTEMTAVARAALGYLADRSKHASEASTIAEWVGKPLPKVQAALVDLREKGLVRYFSGHPGTWSVTPTGYAEIDAATASVDRYKMALESILSVTSSPYIGSDHAMNARAIAMKALGNA